jgi:hypothetical protein
MAKSFDLKDLKKETANANRYEKRMAFLATQGQETERIKTVVKESIQNIERRQRSFVIYGEPQSGKTEMMIALTARLLDFGFQIIVVLLNDSVQLLGQNLERFQRSGLSPTPKKFSEVLPSDVTIGEHKWVIFSKKNHRDLEKLNYKLGRHGKKVVIDDEADFATPNSKINKRERSRINDLTAKLIGDEGIYIGVTATPARLDLNRTHDNQNECWVDLPPHQNYTGQDVFFPAIPDLSKLTYHLVLLPDTGDSPGFMRTALFSFMINVAYLNTLVNDPEKNYSFLIHTSGKKADHSVDYKAIVKDFEILREAKNPKHEKYYKDLWNTAKDRYPGHEEAIIKYILENHDRYNIVVMNSDKEKNVADNRTATTPSAPFTIVIGGNIVSRGVTFNNLLSMFFTRDVKHKMQQDTYVQRARMFGSRNDYLKHFELTIPNSLYLNWHQCFIFHRLSLQSRRTGSGSPVWLEGEKIAATSSGSIDKAHVVVDRGEMSFDLFDYNERDINDVLEKTVPAMSKIKALAELLGKDRVPSYLINYIENFCPEGERSIAIHKPNSIAGYKDSTTDQKNVARAKGFIEAREMEPKKFPDAIHHIFVLYNNAKKARVFYKYQGNIRFLKTMGKR